MTWLKVDDGEWCHPWVSIAGPAAYGVYVRLAGYCAQHETDGLVPAEFAAMIFASAGDRADAVRELLMSQGRIEPAAIGGGILLPFFLDHNPTRAQVQAERETRRARAAKGGAAKSRADKARKAAAAGA